MSVVYGIDVCDDRVEFDLPDNFEWSAERLSREVLLGFARDLLRPIAQSLLVPEVILERQLQRARFEATRDGFLSSPSNPEFASPGASPQPEPPPNQKPDENLEGRNV